MLRLVSERAKTARYDICSGWMGSLGTPKSAAKWNVLGEATKSRVSCPQRIQVSPRRCFKELVSKMLENPRSLCALSVVGQALPILIYDSLPIIIQASDGGAEARHSRPKTASECQHRQTG